MLVTIFCEIDDFCKMLEKENSVLLIGEAKKSKAGAQSKMLKSEIMTITLYYFFSDFKTFKGYYEEFIKGKYRSYFKNVPSYNRFIELRQEIVHLLAIFLQAKALGVCDGASIIDSTTLKVCHVKRASSSKMLKGIAKKGCTGMGYFYGLKFHAVINSKGEIVNFYITPGNVSDQNPKVLDKVTNKIFGKLIGDKGYVGAFQQMHEKGIQMIHRLRNNMHNKLLNMFDKFLLGRRRIIETVFGILKEQFGLESSKSRCTKGFFLNIFGALIAYHFKEKKPCIFPDKKLVQIDAC